MTLDILKAWIIRVALCTAFLFSGTIRDNLRFGRQDATDEEMIEALKVAQAWGFVEDKDGLDTCFHREAKTSLVDKKQRLSPLPVHSLENLTFMSLMILLAPSILKTDIKLRTALSSYASDASVIIVAQRVSSIINADQIVVLDEGKMVGVGSPQRPIIKLPSLSRNC